MTRESRRNLFLVFVIQVLSQSVYFAHGILSTQEFIADPPEASWFAACTPLLYTAIQHLSGPLWRKLMKKRSDRLATMLGATIVATSVAVVVIVFQHPLHRHIVYAIVGGAGMGLVQLPSKLVRSHSGTDTSFRGVGTTGVGLILWPLLACLFSKSHGPKYALLLLAGVALHAVPMAQLLRPSACGNDKIVQFEKSEDQEKILQSVTLTETQQCKLAYQESRFEMHRVRPSHCVEVLPGIPEEDEHDGEHYHENHKSSFIGKKDDRDSSARRKSEYELAVKNLKRPDKPGHSFSYPIFVATTLLRLGTKLSLNIVISIVPIFAGNLMLHLRIQEKAFLVSLCGFSRLLTELPVLMCYRTSKKAKSVLLAGPSLACIGLYLAWLSRTLDAITVASIALGLGSGASAVALRVLAPRQSPVVEDAADFAIGISLLGAMPLVRTLILGHAIRGCFLLGAGVYGTASVIWLIVMRMVP